MPKCPYVKADQYPTVADILHFVIHSSSVSGHFDCFHFAYVECHYEHQVHKYLFKSLLSIRGYTCSGIVGSYKFVFNFEATVI